MDVFKILGIFEKLLVIFFRFLGVIFWNSLGILGGIFLEDFFGVIFLEELLGRNFWEEFFVDIIKVFEYDWFVCQDFGICQDFVSMEKEGKFQSLEVREQALMHFKNLQKIWCQIW